MALMFDVKFKGELTSSTINAKFASLYGANGIIEGFSVTPGTGLQVKLSAGKLVIAGVLITETSVVRTINIPSNTSGAARTEYIYAQYNHTSAQCVFSTTRDQNLFNNANVLKIASVTVPNNASSIVAGNITRGTVLRSYFQTQTDIDALNTAIGITNGNVSALQTSVSGLQSNVSGIGSAVVQLQGDVSSLRSADASLAGSLLQTNTEVTNVKSDVAKAKTDIGKLQTDVASAKTDIGKLQTDVASAKTDISGAKTDISGLNTRFTSMQLDVAKAQSDIGTAKTDITNIGNSLAAHLQNPHDYLRTTGINRITVSPKNAPPQNPSKNDLWVQL